MKKGDLNGIRVYKFRMINQLMLLAYEISNNQLCLILLALGSHENFYRDIKKLILLPKKLLKKYPMLNH